MAALPSFLLVFFASLSLAYAADELKFNAGGLATSDYLPDPVALVTGVDKSYRGPSRPGMKVGISHRWGISDGFVYNFPTGDGTYDVDLIFAEVFGPAQKSGGRLFDVTIEDKVVLENFDVFDTGGADKEVTETFKNIVVKDGDISIAFIKGPAENPMVSGIVLRASDGSDITLKNADGTDTDPADFNTGEGVSETVPETGGTTTEVGATGGDAPVFDHQAHSVAGGPYIETDFNSDGTAEVALDASLSHSHYNNPKTGESGKIVEYEWKADGDVISTDQKFKGTFPVGTTNVQLKVTDQTGDFAFAPTQVKVLQSTSGGAYCYFYQGATKLDKDLVTSATKPDEGHSSNTIKFEADTFPYYKKDGGSPDSSGKVIWAARCVAQFTSLSTKRNKFTVKYRGAGAALYVDGGLKASGPASETAAKSISATVTSGKGQVPIQVIFYKSAATVSPVLQLLINDKIAPSSALGFKASDVLPTISSISRSSVPPDGGGKFTVGGTGFFNSPVLKIGKLTVSATLISANQLQVDDAPSDTATGGTGTAKVSVTNAAGSSNAVTLTYDLAADEGVAWEQTFLKEKSGAKLFLAQVTSIAIGPDSKYYLGSQTGVIHKLIVDKDLIVQEQCASPNVGRVILGLGFNYASKVFRVYVTTNSLYWNKNGPLAGKPDGWANGAVESFVGPGSCSSDCLCYEKKIVTGLPVSNHDHGVNGIVFKNGDMYISVGGGTNAGITALDDKLGGHPETPLSAAILIAKTSKGAGFNGQIKYSNIGNPLSAKVIGGDVSVYASGFRNCFAMTIDTAGNLWATDNGGNFGYGDVSTSCTGEKPFNVKQFDELNLIESKKFYGHPNRNRGECAFGTGVPPKALMVSSTTGVVEYSSNIFKQELKGHLILSKYAASGSGVTWSGKYSGGDVSLSQMTEYSGLSITNGLYGELVMPRVGSEFVAVLKPKYKTPGGPFVISVSPRRGYVGGKVFVSGDNFATGMTVKFGSANAVVSRLVGTNGCFVTVPAGSGVVSVQVTVGGATSTVIPGGDFIYEK